MSNLAIPRISKTLPARTGTLAQRIVLNESLRPGEWVTHLQTVPDGGKHHGHYFPSWDEAYEDYIARCVELGVEPRDLEAEDAATLARGLARRGECLIMPRITPL